MLKDILGRLFKPAPNPHYGKRILIIEDTRGEQVLYARTLEKSGYEVMITSSGAEGLRTASEKPFDLILLDFLLPDGTGAQICQQLKNNKATKEIPVIILTSKDSPSSVIDSYEAGVSYYLAKPVSAKTLLSQVALTLDESS